MTELPEAVHRRIQQLCANGDTFASRQTYSEALQQYWAAWDILPEPKTDWEAATWILVAIGDANFLSRDFVAGKDNLSNAMRCPGAIGNPFIFRECRALLEGQPVGPPSVAEQLEAIEFQMAEMRKIYDPDHVGPAFRKFGISYADLHPMRNRRDAENYLLRLLAAGPKVDVALRQMQDRARQGIRLPGFIAVETIEQMKRFTKPEPGQNILTTSFADRLKKIDSIDPARKTVMTASAEKIVRDSVYPVPQVEASALRLHVIDAEEPTLAVESSRHGPEVSVCLFIACRFV